MGGLFIPDHTRPHLRYPADFAREAQMQLLKQWDMTMPKPRDIETAHKHIVEHVRLAKQDVIGRLESGDRDWDGLRRAANRYIEFQTAADVLSGQTPLER